MTLSLTLFTTCKPFEGKAARVQRNALRSWALGPACEVVVFGDEPGVRECCEEFGFRQVPTVDRTPLGTPLVSHLFEAVEHVTHADLLAFVNADIMLTRDLTAAVEAVQNRFDRFLMIARRWNVELAYDWDFESPSWEAKLRAYVREHGTIEPSYGGVDLFVYRRGLWKQLRPFAIGRTRWDSALIYEARKLGAPVVEATRIVTAVHPNHDYSHYPQNTSGVFKGPEALRNQSLLGGEEFIFTPLNATHVLAKSGIRRNKVWFPPYLLRKLATLPALHPRLRALAPMVRLLTPWWRRLRSTKNKRQTPSLLVSPDEHQRTSTEGRPYPVTIGLTPLYHPVVPPGGDVTTFDTPEAFELNRARMDHLRSLDLPLRGKRVIDVGCGVGHLAQFFVRQGCEVLCVDAREENIRQLKTRYPDLEARVLDLEKDSVLDLGRFDIVFAYGLLYHLENPFRALRSLGSVCDELLLLETVVTDHDLPILRMAEETLASSQALANIGSRPTPSFVVLALRSAGFRYVYAPRTPPDHPDFLFAWKNDLTDSRDGHLLRCSFVASRSALLNPSLVNLFDTNRAS